jgi:glycosyltransferase involved in cell wall biosynthesis
MPDFISIDLRKISDSGIGTYIINLVPLAIASMPDTNFYLLGDLDKLASLSWTNAPRIELISIKSKPFSPQEQIELIAKIPSQTDLLWCPQINIPICYQGKMMVTVHDIIHVAMPEITGSWLARSYIRLLLQSIRTKVDNLVTVSDFTKSELVRLMNFDEPKITVTHLGAANKWFNLPPADSPQSKPFFLFVGNLKPHKNIARLIEAFQSIEDRIDCDLVIVGTSVGMINKDHQLIDRISTLGERIKFTGYIDDARLGQYFTHAVGLVLPSLYEGFGLPAVEAMACGCPVIAGNLASLPEVCQDAAIYCNPYSATDIAAQMLKLANDLELRSQSIERGKKRAAELNYDRCAIETVKVIHQILTK